MRTRTTTCLAAGLIAAASASAQAPSQSRGALLYDTHCIACHTTQMHWRDKKTVTDWPSLKAQVRRWQDAANLGWQEGDIQEVARHLNQRFYGLPAEGTVVSGLRLR